ncbi:MAG: hypothetical protein AAGB13_10550 [Cyanobacteria bacterium P01_F01_bin.33]
MSTCVRYQSEFDEAITVASDEFKKQVSIVSQEAERDSQSLEDEAPVGAEITLGVDFKVDSKLETWSLHLPQVKLVDKKIGSWDVPEVIVKDKNIIFHTPSTRMVMKVVSKYPEVKCEIRGIKTKCKTIWKEIKTKVPEVFMEEQRIVIGIPEVFMKHQDVILGLPEISWESVEFKFHIPVIKVEDVSVQANEIKKKANALKRKTESKIEAEKEEFKADIIENVAPTHTALFDCLKQEATKSLDDGLASIDAYIKGAEQSITHLQSQKVPTDNDAYRQTEETKKQLIKQKTLLIQEKEKVVLELENSQKESLKQIMDSVKNG